MNAVSERADEGEVELRRRFPQLLELKSEEGEDGERVAVSAVGFVEMGRSVAFDGVLVSVICGVVLREDIEENGRGGCWRDCCCCCCFEKV
jgi:hypothetical protein